MKFLTPRSLTLALGLTCLLNAGALAQGQAAPVAAAPAQPATESSLLKIGNTAPKFEVESWVKGSPVESFEPGRIYVVEFWATWCPPCIKGIPHLTELQQKYKGHVTVIGVNVREEDVDRLPEGQAYLPRVQKFVAEMGDKMDYTVAFGGVPATMKQTWYKAARAPGIPFAAVVKDGKIMWMGHPEDIEKPLAEMVAGTFDIQKAIADADKHASYQAKHRDLNQRIKIAADAGDWAKALVVFDELIAHDPQVAVTGAPQRFELVAKANGDEAAYTYAREVIKGETGKSAAVLEQLSRTIIDSELIKNHDYPLALELAKKANDMTEGKRPTTMSTLAKAYFAAGEIDKAVESQTKAIALVPEGTSPKFREALEAKLAEYQAAKH